MNTGILTRQEKTVIAIAHIVMILLTIFALAPFWLLVSSRGYKHQCLHLHFPGMGTDR